MYNLEVTVGEKILKLNYNKDIDEVAERLSRWLTKSRGGSVYVDQKTWVLPSREDFDNAEKIVIVIEKENEQAKVDPL